MTVALLEIRIEQQHVQTVVLSIRTRAVLGEPVRATSVCHAVRERSTQHLMGEEAGEGASVLVLRASVRLPDASPLLALVLAG